MLPLNIYLPYLLRTEHRSLGDTFAFFVLLIASFLLSTYSTTWLQSWPARPGTGREPPTAPYSIPYFQHLFSFLWDPRWTFQSNQARYGSSPFTLKMNNHKFHVFQSAATASHIFSRSRAFTFDPVMASMMENAMDLPLEDRPMFQIPMHKANRHQTEKDNFISANHRIWLKYLSGKQLDAVMDVYMRNLDQMLEEHLDLQEGGWIKVEFHELMRRLIFETSATTFFGTSVRKEWSTMWDDWRAFDAQTYAGVRTNMAYRLWPRAGRARERMLKVYEKWVDRELTDWPEEAGMWKEEWGIRMSWERETLARRFGFSLRGRACLHASFLFVATDQGSQTIN
ncbi:hypothetical protein EJ03DRAFT_182538 [Teratosphaeria nubilosa]|uniref:Cytochrome P450 n=1 Tax=Teratosphaeria nubilosa TaxID=161662 RepID=A0A6G1L060_9PEZI|nr:hypothetical protein EJ03DRAFT_182538 [Teratosphaeria nubilosa]